MVELLVGDASWLILGAVIAFKSGWQRREGRYSWDRFKLRIPIAGKIILKATLARFARSFALAHPQRRDRRCRA